MSRHIRNLEIVYDILVKCRQVFRDLNGDSVVALKKMERLCTEIDNVLDEHKNEQKYK